MEQNSEIMGRDLYDAMGELCGSETWRLTPDGHVIRITRFLRPVDDESYYILTFNQEGLIIKEDYSSGYWVRYEYDERGSIIREINSNGATEYDTRCMIYSPMQYEDGVNVYESRPEKLR